MHLHQKRLKHKHTHPHTHSYTHTLMHTHSLSPTLTHTLSHTLSQTNTLTHPHTFMFVFALNPPVELVRRALCVQADNSCGKPQGCATTQEAPAQLTQRANGTGNGSLTRTRSPFVSTAMSFPCQKTKMITVNLKNDHK